MRAFISQVSDQETRLALPRWPHEHCRPTPALRIAIPPIVGFIVQMLENISIAPPIARE